MIISFQTQNQILEFLVLKSKIYYHRYNEGLIEFNGEKYTVLDFMKLLTDFEIIQQKFTWHREFNYEKREHQEVMKEISIEFNFRNFEVLSSNELVQNSIYPFRLLTIKETSELLGVTRQTVYNLLERNEFISYQILSQQKVRFIDLMKYIESNKNIR